MEFYLYSYPPSKNTTIKEQFEFARKHEIPGIILELQAIKELSQDAGSEQVTDLIKEFSEIKIFGLSHNYDFIRNNFEDTAELFTDLAFLKEIDVENLLITITQLAGSKNITENEHDMVVKSLKRIILIADKFKKNIILKFTPNHIIDSMPQAKKIVNGLLFNNLKFMLDSYRIYKNCHIDPILGFKSLEQHVSAIHFSYTLKEKYKNIFESDFNFVGFRDLLAEHEYKGPIIIGIDGEVPNEEQLIKDINQLRSPYFTPSDQRKKKRRSRLKKLKKEKKEIIPF